jgi:hypothetical protein
LKTFFNGPDGESEGVETAVLRTLSGSHPVFGETVCPGHKAGDLMSMKKQVF